MAQQNLDPLVEDHFAGEEEILTLPLNLAQEDAERYFNAPPPPRNVLEALEQRAKKFRQTLTEAKQESNLGKARRVERIVKRYDAAINDYKAGRQIDLNDLPVPPGFSKEIASMTTNRTSPVKRPPVLVKKKTEVSPVKHTRHVQRTTQMTSDSAPSRNRKSHANSAPFAFNDPKKESEDEMDEEEELQAILSSCGIKDVQPSNVKANHRMKPESDLMKTQDDELDEEEELQAILMACSPADVDMTTVNSAGFAELRVSPVKNIEATKLDENVGIFNSQANTVESSTTNEAMPDASLNVQLVAESDHKKPQPPVLANNVGPSEISSAVANVPEEEEAHEYYIPPPPKNLLEALGQRSSKFRQTLIEAKEEGNQGKIRRLERIVKRYDAAIRDYHLGRAVDIESLPVPLGFPDIVQENQAQKPTEHPAKLNLPTAAAGETTPAAPHQDSKVPTEQTDAILQVLEQRVGKCKEYLIKTQNNQKRTETLEKVLKMYEIAIRDHQAGKKLDYDKLLKLPGFAPLPPTKSTPPSASSNLNVQPKIKPSIPAPSPTRAISTSSGSKTTLQQQQQQNSRPKANENPRRAQREARPRRLRTNSDKQLASLIERQKLFKQAAVESKAKGDIPQAMEYLKMAKGFEPLIEATKSGLPINTKSIPTPPQMKQEIETVAPQPKGSAAEKEKNCLVM